MADFLNPEPLYRGDQPYAVVALLENGAVYVSKSLQDFGKAVMHFRGVDTPGRNSFLVKGPPSKVKALRESLGEFGDASEATAGFLNSYLRQWDKAGVQIIDPINGTPLEFKTEPTTRSY